MAAFAQYFSQSPDRLGRQQIHRYQLYLVRECKFATPTLSQIVSGLRFFYETTLGRHWISERIPYPRHERRLPTVLSRAEVAVLLDTHLKHRAMLAVPVAEPTNETTGADSAQQHRCPLCRQGRMLLVETFEPPRPALFVFFDTS